MLDLVISNTLSDKHLETIYSNQPNYSYYSSTENIYRLKTQLRLEVNLLLQLHDICGCGFDLNCESAQSQISTDQDQLD